MLYSYQRDGVSGEAATRTSDDRERCEGSIHLSNARPDEGLAGVTGDTIA
jgi:hypothetical protein